MKDSMGKSGGTPSPTRRAVVGGAVAAFAAPALISRRGLAAEPLKVAVWEDYLNEEMIKAFRDATGIEISLVTHSEDLETLTTFGAADGTGPDIAFVTNSNIGNWISASKGSASPLLAPIDELRIDRSAIIPALWTASGTKAFRVYGQRAAIPFGWGTYSLVYDSNQRDYDYGKADWKHLWAPENQGRVAIEPASTLTAIALMQEGRDILTRAHEDRVLARNMFERVVNFALAHRPWVQVAWQETDELVDAFVNKRCVVGIADERSAADLLGEAPGRFRFVSPRSGALGWFDSMLVSATSSRSSEIYAFINFCVSAKAGAMYTLSTRFHSAAKGAGRYLGTAYRERREQAFGPNDEALGNIWWQAPEADWYRAMRDEYVARWGFG